MAIVPVTALSHVTSGYSVSPFTTSYDAGSSPKRCLLVAVCGDSGVDNVITGATYGGVPMTGMPQIVHGSQDNARFFFLLDAPAGSNVLAVEFTGSIGILHGAIIAYSGVESLTGYVDGMNGSGLTTQLVTVASASGDTVVGLFFHQTPTEPGSSANERLDAAGTGAVFRTYITDAPGAAPTANASYTTAVNTYIKSKFGVSLTPSSGGGGPAADSVCVVSLI